MADALARSAAEFTSVSASSASSPYSSSLDRSRLTESSPLSCLVLDLGSLIGYFTVISATSAMALMFGFSFIIS